MESIIFDIGSNSVRYYLKEAKQKGLVTTRLAAGLASSGKMSEEGMRNSISAVKNVLHSHKDVAHRFAFATEAVRAASNGVEFAKRMRAETGIELDVLSGEEEAAASFLGGNVLKGKNLVCDIGGASTELSVGEGSAISYRVSLKAGAVRLSETCNENFAEAEKLLNSLLAQADLPSFSNFIAVGGTASAAVTLIQQCEYSPRIHLSKVSILDLAALEKRIASMTLCERRALKGMPRGREDVIASGLFLLTAIMKKAGAREMTFSDCDNLEGYVLLRKLS